MSTQLNTKTFYSNHQAQYITNNLGIDISRDDEYSQILRNLIPLLEFVTRIKDFIQTYDYTVSKEPNEESKAGSFTDFFDNNAPKFVNYNTKGAVNTILYALHSLQIDIAAGNCTELGRAILEIYVSFAYNALKQWTTSKNKSNDDLIATIVTGLYRSIHDIANSPIAEDIPLDEIEIGLFINRLCYFVNNVTSLWNTGVSSFNRDSMITAINGLLLPVIL